RTCSARTSYAWTVNRGPPVARSTRSTPAVHLDTPVCPGHLARGATSRDGERGGRARLMLDTELGARWTETEWRDVRGERRLLTRCGEYFPTATVDARRSLAQL